MTDELTFGKWLLKHRTNAHLTQGELAKRAGISTSYVSTLERSQPHSITNAKLRPDSDVIDRIAKALEADANEARMLAGYAPLADSPAFREMVNNRAEILGGGAMPSGFEDLEDEDLKAAFLADMKTIAESMVKRKLEEQNARRKKSVK